MPNQELNPEVLYQQAIQAYQTGQADQAISLLNQVLKQMPEEDGILATLGGILISSGKFEEGEKTLKKAISLNPSNADAHLNLGIGFQSIGKTEEAFQEMDHAMKLAPDRLDIKFNLSNTYLQAQQFPPAVDLLKECIKINSSFLQAYHTLGSIYSHIQNTEAAIEIYSQALVVFPDDLTTMILLGNILSDVGLTKKAEAIYLQASQKYPDNFLPYGLLGKLYLDINSLEKGEAALLKAFSLNSGDLNTNILLGNLYRDLKRIDDAEKFFRQAVAIDPNHQGALSNLRRVLSSKIPYWHFEMLADTDRNDAYQKAIEKIITPKSSILDIGTGSGLLSMMAARAGAKQIIACEMNQRLAVTAKEIIELNGYDKIIDVLPIKSTELETSDKVDIIISEILDVGGLGEGVLPSIRHAVQNLATPDVKLIPSRVHLFGKLVEIPSRSLIAPIKKISGFDLSPFEQYRIPNEYFKVQLKAEKHKVLSPAIPLLDIDFYNLPPAYPDDQPKQTVLNFDISKSGIVQAVIFWFDLYLDDEIKVSSKVDGELEHWGQALFCFPEPVSVEKGDSISLTMLQSDMLIKFKL